MSSMPGNPVAIHEVAASLTASSASMSDASDAVATADADDWSGDAHAKYAATRTTTIALADRVQADFSTAANALTTYASVLSALQTAYDAAKADMGSAAALMGANPATILVNMRRYDEASEAAITAVGAAQGAAKAAADTLNGLLQGVSDEEKKKGELPWWDPWGWSSGRAVGPPTMPVPRGLLDPENFDPDDLSQGGIGDCFVLSTVLSLLGTEGGDKFIRDHIRWDESAGGYYVTLYDDAGNPEEILVTDIYAKGARDDADDKPSIASLYEAALAKKYDKAGKDYLDRGYQDEAMRRITGKSESTGGWWIFGTSVDDARQTLEDGGQAVISSPREDSGGARRLTVRDDQGNESTQSVQFVTRHSYTVTQIEANGDVWIRNPWGPGNGYDGGNQIKVPAAMVDGLFGKITFTNVTKR